MARVLSRRFPRNPGRGNMKNVFFIMHVFYRRGCDGSQKIKRKPTSFSKLHNFPCMGWVSNSSKVGGVHEWVGRLWGGGVPDLLDGLISSPHGSSWCRPSMHKFLKTCSVQNLIRIWINLRNYALNLTGGGMRSTGRSPPRLGPNTRAEVRCLIPLHAMIPDRNLF